jgi:hypothetical protein
VQPEVTITVLPIRASLVCAEPPYSLPRAYVPQIRGCCVSREKVWCGRLLGHLLVYPFSNFAELVDNIILTVCQSDQLRDSGLLACHHGGIVG